MKRIHIRNLVVVACGTMGLFLPSASFAGVVIIPTDDDVKIPVDKQSGSLLQLPSSVKTITPSAHFEISDVGSDVDAVSGGKVDVRLFSVRALAGARSERVTFVLGNGRAVKVRLVPADEADAHYDLVFPSESKKRKNPRFLQNEMALMKAMIRDEAGEFARQVTSETVALVGVEGMKATLVRVYASAGVVGYAFEIKNRSGGGVTLAPQALSVGAHGRAVLSYADRESLESCRLSSKPACTARVLVVARGEVSESRGLSSNPASSMPFMRPEPAVGGAP
jgi:hypothetical protein